MAYISNCITHFVCTYLYFYDFVYIGGSKMAGGYTSRGLVGLDSYKYVHNRKGNISTNWTYMLNRAIRNLHNCLWFGIFENLIQSLELFHHQTGLHIKMDHINRNDHKAPTNNTISKIKQLIPMDLYIYEYA